MRAPCSSSDDDRGGRYGLFIFNRECPENFILPVADIVQYKLEAEFFMYLAATGAVFGIWCAAPFRTRCVHL